jgi:ATP-binding protein involved in chromosome partitioning
MTRRLRTYAEVVGPDRSGLAAQVGVQRDRVRRRLASVKAVVAVMSGKGGVGKSAVTAGLARALAGDGARAVGVLDADLHGPTVARLLGARGPVRVDAEAVHPVVAEGGVRVFSTDLLLDDGHPLSWRGPDSERFVWRSTLEAGALREFLADVAWGALDVLLVDLPPGADRLADLAALAPLAGAVAVTLPSEESRRAVARAIRAARADGVALLGVVENMSGYACRGCDAVQPLFPGDAGAALAREFDAPLLGRIPFVPGDAPPPVPSTLTGRVLEVLA